MIDTNALESKTHKIERYAANINNIKNTAVLTIATLGLGYVVGLSTAQQNHSSALSFKEDDLKRIEIGINAGNKFDVFEQKNSDGVFSYKTKPLAAAKVEADDSIAQIKADDPGFDVAAGAMGGIMGFIFSGMFIMAADYQNSKKTRQKQHKYSKMLAKSMIDCGDAVTHLFENEKYHRGPQPGQK